MRVAVVFLPPAAYTSLSVLYTRYKDRGGNVQRRGLDVVQTREVGPPRRFLGHLHELGVLLYHGGDDSYVYQRALGN